MDIHIHKSRIYSGPEFDQLEVRFTCDWSLPGSQKDIPIYIQALGTFLEVISFQNNSFLPWQQKQNLIYRIERDKEPTIYNIYDILKYNLPNRKNLILLFHFVLKLKSLFTITWNDLDKSFEASSSKQNFQNFESI